MKKEKVDAKIAAGDEKNAEQYPIPQTGPGRVRVGPSQTPWPSTP